jgi:NADP-dependent 3-hydroxy acid dehydrogenase YdfG
MSKQNGGDGGIIINMSSLAGKDSYYGTSDIFLFLI